MKPISLTMQAFGSYGEKTTIDFTKPTQNLFLITGDTGSGKTTIFDAIVFALYGKASSTSNTKEGEKLQSQFANITVEPFVELVFSEKSGLDEEIYTVRRVPKHTRAKQRGDGQTDEGAKISLFMPDGREYSNKLAESNKKLEEIVGLTREQFMQVAMIAQGEFMEVLRSKSNDKKEIYRKLFGTEQYDKIVKEFKKRRDDKQKDIQQIKAICQTDISRVSVSSDEEGAQDLLELQERIRSSDELNIVDMESFLEQLKTLCDHLQEKEREAKTKKEKTAKVRDEKQKKLTRAESLLSAFDQLNTAKNELNECEKNEVDIREKDRLSETIDISYDLKGEHDRYVDAKTRVEQTEKVLREQQANLPSLEQKCKVTDEAKNTAEEKWQEVAQKYSKVEDRVKKALSVFAEISEKEKALDKANEELQKANGTFNSAKKKFDDFERQVGEWNKEKNDLAGTTLKLEKCNQKIKDAKGILEDINSLEETKQNISSLTDEVEKAKQAYTSVREEYESKNKEYQTKRNAFFDAQAGILAKEKLVEGKPCPVCGSLEHPSPCALSEEHQGLTREEIENLERQVSQCNKNQQEKSEEARSLGVQLDGQQTSYEEKFRKLKERIATVFPDTFATLPDDFSLDAAKSIINKQKEALLTEQNDLSKKADRLSEIEDALKTAESKTEELKGIQAKAEQKKNDAQQTVSNCETKLKTLCESQTEYSSGDEAKNALNQVKSKKAAAETAYKHAKDAAEEAKSKRDKAKTLINDYTEKLPGLEEERDTHKDNYGALLREKNIPEETWKKTVGQYTKEQASKFREMVNDHNEKSAAAKRAYDNAKAQIDDEQRPNIDELKADVQQAEKDFQTADKTHSEIRNNYGKNNEVYQNLASTMDKRKQIVQTYDQIESMYGRLAGKVSGGRMDLETFAQRYYLQQILIAANARFQKMSGGQFELRMIDQEEAGKGNTNSGLDLNVYSTVTETERDVRTLSGGESFMAALSLALGMADQIRSSSAAVNLDIMFIDEGFGSLDEESRNQAVRVLQDMAGGEKLVGIISHVTELKQQIDDQLIVTKDDKGSHTKWQLS